MAGASSYQGNIISSAQQQHMYGQGLLGGGHPNPYPTPHPRAWEPMDKLRMRLNVPQHHQIEGFDYINAIENPKANNVVVFLIKEGKPLIFEDEMALFPSDALVGKLSTLR